MAVNSDYLATISTASGLINGVYLSNSLGLIATLILIVAPCCVIIKELCVARAEPKHNVCVVTRLDCSHLPAYWICLIGREPYVLLDKSFEFNSVAVKSDFYPWKLRERFAFEILGVSRIYLELNDRIGVDNWWTYKMQNWSVCSIVCNSAVVFGILWWCAQHTFHLLSHFIKIYETQFVRDSFKFIKDFFGYTMQFANSRSRVLKFPAICMRAKSNVLYIYLIRIKHRTSYLN